MFHPAYSVLACQLSFHLSFSHDQAMSLLTETAVRKLSFVKKTEILQPVSIQMINLG
jgi:hypothetical protein